MAVLSLFSGAGGLSLGWTSAGLKPVLGVEIAKEPVETYRRNIGKDCLQADVAVDHERIVAEARARVRGDLLAVIGGPPCQGFSTAGARTEDDPRNRLIFSYLEIVRDLAPRWFLFENVEGLLTSGNGVAVESLAHRFTALGYTLRIEKVSFAGYGLPQARKRVLLIGNRIGVHFELPRPGYSFEARRHRGTGYEPAPTLAEAIAGLGEPRRGLDEIAPYSAQLPQSTYDAAVRNGFDGCRQHVCRNYERDLARIVSLRPGQSMKDLPEHLWHESYRSRRFRRVMDGMPVERRGGPPAALQRLEPDRVSLTITSASSREFVHPTADRTISLRECARLQGFPDAFEFCGGFTAVALQIGNAFPSMVARVFADWIIGLDGRAGSGLSVGRTAKPGIIGFRLTGATGLSPALAEAEGRLRKMTHHSVAVGSNPKQWSFFTMRDKAASMLDADTRRLITKVRTAKPIVLSDRELGRLISILLRDLGYPDLVPAFVELPSSSYYETPLDWFTRDDQRPFRFEEFFLRCERRVASFRTILACLAELHKRRRKYDRILSGQPMPTMDQVARRGLLEYGVVGLPALTSWLMWRKWIYDIDNRSAQETGYLFEPILARSLGGESYGSTSSPITRANGGGGRQVDCVVDAGGEKLAYEFKIRFTIAASGQGRFREELDFPRDCRASGYKPILLVLDPTPNDKLEALVRVFAENGGASYLGDDAWRHVAERSGEEIATFVTKYVREPIERIDEHSRQLLSMTIAKEGDGIRVMVGAQSWTIVRTQSSDEVTE